MDISLISRLKLLGFVHQEFPDGWFWHLTPEADEEKILLAKALGFEDDCWDGPPDTVILQVDESGANWQFVFGSDYGSLDEHEVLEVLLTLEDGNS